MQCPLCHQEHPDGVEFCPVSGKKILPPDTCPSCGSQLDPGWQHCGYCGQKLILDQGASSQQRTETTGSDQAPISMEGRSKPGAGSPKAVGVKLVFAAFGLLILAAIVYFAAGKGGDQGLTLQVGNISPAIFSKDSGRVVFESTRDGNLEIYVMNTNGSGLTRLTDNPASDGDPNWSGDNKKIAFSSNRDGNWEIYVMNADGSAQTNLSSNLSNEAYPDWSLDGQKIAFTSDRDGSQEIYVMNADGSNQTRLTYNDNEDSFPAWSADGHKIVFMSNRESNWGSGIYIMNADGSSQTNLSNSPGAQDFFPALSTDGQKIAFTSDRNPDAYSEIFLMNIDGSGQTSLAEKWAQDVFPAWSGDNSKIVFASGRDGNSEIYTLPIGGKNYTRLTNNEAYDGFPDWSHPSPPAEIQPPLSAPGIVIHTPVSGTKIVSKQYGISFIVPGGIELYSESNPGIFSPQLSAKEPFILVNPGRPEENVSIKIVEGMTGTDLNSYKEMLDTNPVLPLLGYKRISVGYLNFGRDEKIRGIEHIFQMQGNVSGTIRSISFVIGNRGYTITCGTSNERLEEANREFLQPFLNSFEAVK